MHCRANREENGWRKLGPLQHRIELDQVSFSYKPELGNALTNITLEKTNKRLFVFCRKITLAA